MNRRRGLGWRLTLGLLVGLMSGTAQASCISHKDDAKAASSYTLQQGIAKDNKTGLEWMRCPAGTTWHSGGCQGQASLMRLGQAQQWVKALGPGWRLPSIQELALLVERRCQPPAINAHVFPGIDEWVEGGAPFWSSTPVPEMPPLIYFIDFYRGETDGRTPRALNAVRAVRGTAAVRP